MIEQRKPSPWRWPLWLAAAGNAVAVLSCLPLYNIPIGQKVNGAGWFGGMVMLALVILVPGAIVLPGALRDRALTWRWFAVAMAVTPLPLSVAIAHHAQWLRGFTFQ